MTLEVAQSSLVLPVTRGKKLIFWIAEAETAAEEETAAQADAVAPFCTSLYVHKNTKKFYFYFSLLYFESNGWDSRKKGEENKLYSR